MKIALLNVSSGKKACINKDFMGGYGWAFNAGTSARARMINYVKRAGEKLPIMSFGYLASVLSEKGCEVEYAENRIPSADIVVMQSSMVEHDTEMGWARRLKGSGKRVGFIGPFSGAMPDIFLNDCDFVVRGEPEGTFYALAAGAIPRGLVDSAPIEDIDRIPFPKWDIFPYKEYSYFPAIKERPFLPVLSSRGCAYGCNYCPYLVDYRWRQRSPQNVLDEIGYLVRSFGVRSMLFRDPIFTFDRKRTAEICDGIIKRGYRVKWACETRLDKVDKELLRHMYSAGLRVMNVGVESGSVEVIRKASRKPVDIQHQEDMIRFCDALGIRVTAFYMFGMPDDTEKTLLGTIRYAKSLNTHVAQFFIFTPFPGTEYYSNIKKEIEETDWEKFDCYTPVFRHGNLSRARLLELKEKAFVSYYYRPAWALALAGRAMRDIFNR